MGNINLKEFRKANRISQQELAEYLGVGQGYVSQMERGERPIPDYAIEKILANTEWKVVVDELKDKVQVSPDIMDLDLNALRREIAMLQAQVEELKAEKAQYWEVIKSLTAK